MIGASKISHGIYLFMHHILCGPLGKKLFKLRCITRQNPVSYALSYSSPAHSADVTLAPSYSGFGSGQFYKLSLQVLSHFKKLLL